MPVMVQRSPFLTQSVAVRRSRRSLLRVIITSPALAWFPSASRTTAFGMSLLRRWFRGSPVQLGHLIAGRGKHDRVEPSRSIGNPRVERILSRGSHVADMNTAVIKVEHQPRMVALADGKRCCRFGGVGEAMQLSQPEGAISVLDVAKYTAGADRGELLIITDQAYVRTPANGELHSGVQRQGVGHAGFVDDQQGRRADRCRPLRKVAVL